MKRVVAFWVPELNTWCNLLQNAGIWIIRIHFYVQTFTPPPPPKKKKFISFCSNVMNLDFLTLEDGTNGILWNVSMDRPGNIPEKQRYNEVKFSSRFMNQIIPQTGMLNVFLHVICCWLFGKILCPFCTRRLELHSVRGTANKCNWTVLLLLVNMLGFRRWTV
jgi:hypothetical protein